MLSDIEVEDAPAVVGEHDEDEQNAQARGGNSEEIDGDEVLDVIGQERAPPLRRGERRFGSRRETVRSATSMPSLRSSPWILGAPHRGLAAAILLTRALIAASTGGWPAGRRPESVAQWRRKRAPRQPSARAGAHRCEGRPP